MKIHVEMDMTAEEARTLMGLPDVKALNEQGMTVLYTTHYME